MIKRNSLKANIVTDLILDRLIWQESFDDKLLTKVKFMGIGWQSIFVKTNVMWGHNFRTIN